MTLMQLIMHFSRNRKTHNFSHHLCINTRHGFAGFGWVLKVGNTLKVYDFDLLHVGSENFTDIPAARIIPLIDRSDNQNMRLWVHKHPLGNGIPGPWNWSPVDHDTCTLTPMGGLPELILFHNTFLIL